MKMDSETLIIFTRLQDVASDKLVVFMVFVDTNVVCLEQM
jgi:hypothetical protein